MSLGKIRRELYKKETGEEILQHEQSEFNPVVATKGWKDEETGSSDLWTEKKTDVISENKKAVKIGVIAAVSIILLVGLIFGFYKIRQSFFASERVVISVEGPREIKSGNLTVFEIKYKNENRAELKNVVLKLTYSEDFKPEDSPNFKTEGSMAGSYVLGTIKGNAEGKVAFSGRAYSPKGNLIKISANLVYTPSTVSSEFTVMDQLAVSVSSSPITLELQAPQNSSSGDEVNYVITYKNSGATTLPNLRVRLTYPDRFTFSKSDPKVAENNNVWYVGNLAPGQGGKIVATGKLEGRRDDIGSVSVMIGANENGTFMSYNEENAQTKIVASPLTIVQTVNGLKELTVNAQESLSFELIYKNEGSIGLRDVIVTEKIDSSILDYASLNLKGGSYDAGTKIITWKASDYKELKNLAPGQGGSIKFSIRIKDIIPVVSVNDKNFIVSTLAKIDSPDVPTPVSVNKIIAGNQMDMKLNSKLVLDVKGYFVDANIPNSGPIPPKVGEETTYTLHFSALNISNDIVDAKVETILPTAVVFTGKIFPEGSSLIYNERNNSILWNVGAMNAGVGITSSPREVAFQVKIKPSINQAGDDAPLLGKSNFSAKDSFTGESLSFTAEAKTSKLPEDPTIKSFAIIK